MRLPTAHAATILSAVLVIPAGTVEATGNVSNIDGLTTDTRVCFDVVDKVEKARKIPGQLLWAVALAESGRWDAKKEARFAWPWTVNAGGKGQFFPTKRAAITHVRKLRARGVRNIDVGCMQVNLMYHPKAFDSLEEAFDPAANAAYAGRLLLKLRRTTRSWAQAVRHYHSSRWKNGRQYWQRVVVIWNDERRIASERARLRQLEQHRQQRLARLVGSQ